MLSASLQSKTAGWSTTTGPSTPFNFLVYLRWANQQGDTPTSTPLLLYFNALRRARQDALEMGDGDDLAPPSDDHLDHDSRDGGNRGEEPGLW